MSKKRVAVLISGRGSNMMALIEAAKANDYPAEIALVVSNRPDAAGLGPRARRTASQPRSSITSGLVKTARRSSTRSMTRSAPIGSISFASPDSCGC